MDIKRIKKVTSYMFSFLLVLSILLSFALNLVSRTILSEEYMVTKLFETDYYTNIMSTIQSDFEGYIDQSGFDKIILDNVFTRQDVTADVNLVIRSIYHNSSYNINTSVIEQNLNKNIENYVRNNNINLDIKQQENVKVFVDTLTASYVKDIFPKDIIIPTSNIISTLNTVISRLGQFIHLLPYILMLCIITVNISKILTSFKYISIAILSSGIFLCITHILLINIVQAGKITIFTKSISDMLNLLVNNIFKEINFFFIVFSLTGILLTLIFVVIENKFKFEILSHKGVNSNKWMFRY